MDQFRHGQTHTHTQAHVLCIDIGTDGARTESNDIQTHHLVCCGFERTDCLRCGMKLPAYLGRSRLHTLRAKLDERVTLGQQAIYAN